MIRSIRPSTVMPGATWTWICCSEYRVFSQRVRFSSRYRRTAWIAARRRSLAQGRVCERGVQVPIDQVLGVQAGDDVAVDGALVHLGHHVVDGLAVAEGLMDRRVEAVQEPELELVRALEEVLQVAEAERDLWHLVPRLRVEPAAGTAAGSVVRKYWFFAAKSKNGDRARYIAESPGE